MIPSPSDITIMLLKAGRQQFFDPLPHIRLSKKSTRHTKRQKQNLKTEQASEPESDTAAMLELSGQEFKNTD